jgi:hypothetical protein
MKNLKKTLLPAIAFIIIIFLVHGFFSYFVNDTNVIRALKPIRDILFFPLMIITENTFEIYCWIAKIGLLEHGRCIVPTGPGINMAEGPPSWFGWSTFISSLILMVIYYTVIFKAILKIISRFHSSANKV